MGRLGAISVIMGSIEGELWITQICGEDECAARAEYVLEEGARFAESVGSDTGEAYVSPTERGKEWKAKCDHALEFLHAAASEMSAETLGLAREAAVRQSKKTESDIRAWIDDVVNDAKDAAD